MKNKALASRDPGMLPWWIEEDCLDENNLRCFSWPSHYGPSDAVGSVWPMVRGWSGWVTAAEGFGDCEVEMGQGCRWAVVKG